jgi:hypothetical protein
MIYRIINRNNLGILLTTILTLSMLFSNILLVQGDAGGTGKFLTINFVGDNDLLNSECQVIAIKSSGQTFTFSADYETEYNTQQMAAGTVQLTAIPDDGWVFIKFNEVNGALETDPDDPNIAYFKNVKYGEVDAVFEKELSTIVATSTDGGGINPSGSKTYPENSQPVYTFTPDSNEYHLSAVIIDEVTYASLGTTGFTTSYTFDPLTSNHTIHAVWSLDGQTIVDEGENIIGFLSSGVSLSFEEVTSSGITYGYPLVPVIDDDLIVWSITMGDDLDFTGAVNVGFQYNPDSIITEILVCHDPDVELFFRCDLDGDGKVTGQDVNIISNIVKHPKFVEDLSEEDFAKYNLNNDDVIDENDIHVVNSFNGMDYSDFTWVPLIIQYDEEYNVIYGITEGFSLFRCR